MGGEGKGILGKILRKPKNGTAHLHATIPGNGTAP